MRYIVLCCDYDGTLATEGTVFPETAAAVVKLRASGRRMVLVTGRELDELKTVCQCLHLFDYVVAENGALLYHPQSDTETPLGQRPPDSFVRTLSERGVARISVGRVIVATWEPWETTVLETIRDHGLELQVIFNKGAVMVLPAGVNKASGLAAALEKMGLSRHNAVGVGDAENDHALLGLCEFGAAVANALPTLKERADLVTAGARGEGVQQLIAEMLRDDLASHPPRKGRNDIAVGYRADGSALGISPYGHNVTLIGPPGAPRHAVAGALLERLGAAHYTYCLVDPRREFTNLPDAVTLGTRDRPPGIEEVTSLLRDPAQSGILDLSSLAGTRAAAFFVALQSQLQQLRGDVGLPHWVAVNAADHLLSERPEDSALGQLPGRLLIGSEPEALGAGWLQATDLLLLSGAGAARCLQNICRIAGFDPPPPFTDTLADDEVLAWWPRNRATPERLRITASPAQSAP